MWSFNINLCAIKVLALISALLSTVTISFSAGAQSVTEPKNSFYFGRYTFQVASTNPKIWSAYKIGDKKIEFISKNGRRAIEDRISASISEINKLHESGYPTYEQTVRLAGGGAVVVSKDKDYTFEIFYMTAKNTLYRQLVDSIDLESFNKAMMVVNEINSLINYRQPITRPPAGTFAIEAGYINIPNNKFPEQVSIGLPVTSKPGIHLTFDTQIIGVPEPRLIARYEKRSSGIITPLLKSVLSRTTLMRKTTKIISGLPFDELLLKSTAEGKTLYAFRLEFPGTPESSMQPYTVLELSTVDKGPGFKNDEEALRFWDELVASLERI